MFECREIISLITRVEGFDCRGNWCTSFHEHQQCCMTKLDEECTHFLILNKRDKRGYNFSVINFLVATSVVL